MCVCVCVSMFQGEQYLQLNIKSIIIIMSLQSKIIFNVEIFDLMRKFLSNFHLICKFLSNVQRSGLFVENIKFSRIINVLLFLQNISKKLFYFAAISSMS